MWILIRKEELHTVLWPYLCPIKMLQDSLYNSSFQIGMMGRDMQESSPAWGAVIHLDHQREMIKDERPLQLDSIEISLPVSFDYNTPVVWIPFTICAIIYHQGRNVTSGHFRTAVCQNVGGWRNYHDSQIPQHMVELPAFVLSRITLVWLIRKQLLTITDMVEVVDDTEPKPWYYSNFSWMMIGSSHFDSSLDSLFCLWMMLQRLALHYER